MSDRRFQSDSLAGKLREWADGIEAMGGPAEELVLLRAAANKVYLWDRAHERSYRLVQSWCPLVSEGQPFDAEINAYLDAGWSLHGPTTVTYHCSHNNTHEPCFVYTQALVKGEG